MKKLIALLGVTAVLIGGCGNNRTLIKSYTSDITLKNTQVSDLIVSNDISAFAKDLCVVPLTGTGDTSAFSVREAFVCNVSTKQAYLGANIFEKMAPASVTKIMTALMVLKYGNMDDTVVFPKEALVDDPEAKLCNFNEGDVMTVEQLFNAMLVYSGNDAANALAIYISGSMEEFANLMNEEAFALGAVDTHFVNPSGLHDADHYTTAYDLYLMFNECITYDLFKESIHQKIYSMTYTDAAGEKIEASYSTTNQYLTGGKENPYNVTVYGGKTGTTNEAGNCLILYIQDNQSSDEYIAVILGAQDSDELYSQMNDLIALTEK